MSRFKKIIFLDEDNTALGPLTAAIFRKKLEENGMEEIRVGDLGNVVLFPEPINQKIEELAKSYDIDIEDHKARELEEKDFSDTTLVLAMDNESKTRAYNKFPSAVNVFALKEYIGSTGDLKLPLGGDLEDYRTVTDIVSTMLDTLIDVLKEKDNITSEGEDE